MTKLSVVRKIDEFGRITLPKDMRKKLQIKDDEFIELVFENDGIVLKKHLPMDLNNSYYVNYADAIHMETGKNVAISDRNNIIATAGSSEFKKKYLNKPVSAYLDEIIQDRDVIKTESGDEVYITEGVKEGSHCVIAPIYSDEAALGTVIVCSDHNETEIDELIVKTCQIAAKFLGKDIQK